MLQQGDNLSCRESEKSGGGGGEGRASQPSVHAFVGVHARVYVYAQKYVYDTIKCVLVCVCARARARACARAHAYARAFLSLCPCLYLAPFSGCVTTGAREPAGLYTVYHILH